MPGFTNHVAIKSRTVRCRTEGVSSRFGASVSCFSVSRLWGQYVSMVDSTSSSPDHARHILHFSLTVPRTSIPKGDRVEAESGHVDGARHRIPRFGEKTSPEPRLAGLVFWLEETLAPTQSAQGPHGLQNGLVFGLIPDTEVKLRQCVSGFQGGIPDPGGHSGS